MESVRYFQPPCLSGLVQYSFKGHNSLKTATATPLPQYGLQVWKKQQKVDHKYLFFKARAVDFIYLTHLAIINYVRKTNGASSVRLIFN